MSKEGTNEFLSRLNGIFQKKEIVITDLDESKPDDQALALRVSLRGKTEDEYFSIVGDLHAAYDATSDEKEKERLTILASAVMAAGEDTLGIDWS
ncbi:MAG: hypothetical protein UV71_C0004G0012 [Microgenomates group bacterium GW2011_GWC1_43_13]|uniref:Uncharacterized protein n=2 Tax=Candidatus Woeseibacteriota TaxID=1752722 RepID=A0A1F8DK82_9BACT|nr:MAG: hypothetical protein UV71_C0004G0012 [Microgenomates group bacterium GW2011_GWC1_43_13]KKT32993.1 MAG: hypothetical protein UW20_C0006G0010 [Candidatus Woesebacteria bacterium GW2011_GWB1_44_11]OGM75926.1 MAG: hypothetical protein A2208_01405 [Candidatus Woesebacteria bacterium RIFOXYA1_FULL_43_16]OGM81457.1 MAG: hypothetical protein A2394_02975 [Candidatus Woesebacteria bacterium RIFOXYB1_FULL_42_36]OGM84678.1 MAG: hypothetical protein A2421_03255 [Candidatus Woesebacteria bacterium RI